MGVSGAGKTSLGAALAGRLDAQFVDADDLHPPANRAKMAAGEPLNDADRAPWLDAVAQVIARWAAAREDGVVACSALKRAYRDRLRAADPRLVTVFLDVGKDELKRRLSERRGHFFPPDLLASQLATLERPEPDEQPVVVPGDLTLSAAVDAASSQLDRI